MFVSSRPWNCFEEAFGRDTSWHLRLEEHTGHDIALYVHDTIWNCNSFARLQEEDSEYQSVIEEVVGKAHGVFLWVFLVVRSLNRGLTNGDTISDLQGRLRQFPEQLEPYFKHMLSSIDGIYRSEMAEMLQIALLATEPYPLMTYSLLRERHIDIAIKKSLRAREWGDMSAISRIDRAKKQVNSRCQDLLQVYTREQDLLDKYKVDFLHRTVKDFLHLPDASKMISASVKPGFEPHKLLCRTFLAMLQSIPAVDHLLSPQVLYSLGLASRNL